MPANAITLQTVIATILAVLVFFVLGAGGSDPYKVFYALYAGVTIVWCISTALLFLDIFFAKTAEPERFEQERRISLGWLYVCGAVGFVVNILAVLLHLRRLVVPDRVSRISAEWNAWMIGITAVSVIAAIVIYLISQSTRRGKTDEQFIAGGPGRTRRSRRTPHPAEPMTPEDVVAACRGGGSSARPVPVLRQRRGDPGEGRPRRATGRPDPSRASASRSRCRR